MASLVETQAGDWTAVDLAQRFGPIPLHRVRTNPPPGTATEEDLLAVNAHEDRLCELVDGVLVEKAMGSYESYLAMRIGSKLGEYAETRGLGIVLGADGMVRFAPGLVRLPDLAFFPRAQLPRGTVPRESVWRIIPTLAVEVVSRSNTPEEMQGKLQEYFAAGVRLVWYVYPDRREAHLYASPEQFTVVGEDGALDGADVVPGFRLDLKTLFAEPGEATDPAGA